MSCEMKHDVYGCSNIIDSVMMRLYA